ncbi:MAG: D-alanyl-D-alanine carboxypeptidase/D-alanyl-D-alanine-endopeptidase [Burkholderiales bacterium]|nr:D-alanyl-D-alanine carboxypeptidase/D-alanyl-D-alanine-endopeptidase [Burkholderiales bacterium]
MSYILRSTENKFPFCNFAYKAVIKHQKSLKVKFIWSLFSSLVVKKYLHLLKLFILYIFVLCINQVNALDVNIPNEIKPSVSILVVNASNESILYSLNAKEPRLVASNVKLFTTFFALSELKPDFRWQTKLYYTGKINDGVLDGDLYLVGSGDPTLDDKAVYEILSSLKRAGIYKIRGKVILDSSIFKNTAKYSMLETNPYDPDTILPSGLMINGERSLVNVSVYGESVALHTDLYGFKLNNNLKVNKRESQCIGLYNRISIKKELSDITLNGKVAYGCQNKNLTYKFLSNFAYNRTIVYKVLNDFNIIVTGDVIDGVLNNKLAKLIYKYNSPSLAEVLINMNRYSINLVAEALILTIGAYKTSNYNTYDDGVSKFVNFLSTHKLLNKKTVIENGAGLSRFEYFSAENLNNLLNQISHSPYKSEIIASLPIPNLDGTLRKRYTKFQENIHAKTGTLNDTSALCGYFISNVGITYYFSFIFNSLDELNIVQREQLNNLINNVLEQLNK